MKVRGQKWDGELFVALVPSRGENGGTASHFPIGIRSCKILEADVLELKCNSSIPLRIGIVQWAISK